MSPTGIEPATTVPETDALSTELRGLWHNHTIKVNAAQPDDTDQPPLPQKRNAAVLVRSCLYMTYIIYDRDV